MKFWWAVGLAGSLGAVLRYEAGLWAHDRWHSAFPIGTLLINLSGCLVLGWFTAWTVARPALPEWLRLGLGTGLIGAYTTFSTFSVETLTLLREGRPDMAAFYVALSLFGGLTFAWTGFRLGAIRANAREKGAAAR